jgi:ribosome-associated toxin RatA of RatAB toxin-antitoxin module
MHAERFVDINAPAAAIYELAQDVARWPQILPHYRWVRVLQERDDTRTVEMAARRGFIPVRWKALQRCDRREPRISFRHLSGWTKGMEVAWRFEPAGERTRVTIVHHLDYSRFGPGGEWFGRRIIGDYFIQSIAGRTLARMKELAEAAHG